MAARAASARPRRRRRGRASTRSCTRCALAAGARAALRARQRRDRGGGAAARRSRPTTSRGSWPGAQAERVDLVVVGPEAPLVAGLADALAATGIRCFGPTRRGGEARGLQGVLQGGDGGRRRADRRLRRGHRRRGRHGGDRRAIPRVIKADGLAAGKGVIIAQDEAQAREALERAARERAVRHRAGGRRGAPRRRGAVAAGAVRRRGARCRWPRRRTTSGSSTATRGPTPAAWAPTRRCRAIDAERAAEICAVVHQPVLRRAGATGNAVPRRAVRRA